MSDLTDNQLRDVEVGLGSDHLRDAVSEIKRRRAEQAAGREHVERVVREEIARNILSSVGERQNVAARVADRLSVPVLSGEDLVLLRYLRDDCATAQVTAQRYSEGGNFELAGAQFALLDRLIAAGKP